MPGALLDSQFAALEPLREDEQGITVSVTAEPEEITARAAAALRALPASPVPPTLPTETPENPMERSHGSD